MLCYLPVPFTPLQGPRSKFGVERKGRMMCGESVDDKYTKLAVEGGTGSRDNFIHDRVSSTTVSLPRVTYD